MLDVFVYSWLGLDELLEQADALELRTGTAGYKATALYIKVLNQLKSFPHQGTQTMAESLAEIVTHNLVFVSLSETAVALELQVTTIEGSFQQAILWLPVHWLEIFQEDPIYQLGGVLYTGSQAVDFYNGRLTQDPAKSASLAQAHEAELLWLVAREFPGYQFDLYQSYLRHKFSKGLNTPKAKELLYPLAPVEAIEA